MIIKREIQHELENLMKGIKYFQRISREAVNGFLIYSGDLTFDSDNFEVINFSETYKALS